MANSQRVARYTMSLAALVQPVVSLFYLRIFHFVLLFGFVLFVLKGGLKTIRYCLRTPYTVAILLLFIYPVVTYLWSTYPDETLYRASVVIVQIPVFLLTLAIVLNASLPNVYRFLVLYVTAFALVSICIFIVYGTFRPDTYAMKQVVGSFSNSASSTVLCCLPFFLMNRRRALSNYVSYGLVGLSVAIIVLSQSRSALGLLVIAIILTLLFSPDSKLNRIMRFLFGVLCASCIFLYITSSGFGNQVVGDTVTRFFDSQLISGSNILDSILNPDRSGQDYVRTLMYQQGLELIKNNWLFGAGFGTLKSVMADSVGRGTVSHNWIITSLGEMGVVCFLVLIYVLIQSLYYSLRASVNRSLSPLDRVFPTQVFIGLSLLIMQGLTRPLFANPLFGVFLAFSVSVVYSYKVKRVT